ncbi:Peptidase_M28 domain-containing protein [Tenacibaculum sp. 190130A14a]|uniref:Peptidase_M28 domain-containing protein n=1 Tax=Tenacibaculum polynesiense TaxID=3137857 RepID=A0ABM9PAT5_9FLAO
MKSTTKFASILVILFTVYWSFKDIIPSEKQTSENLKESGFLVDNALYHLRNISKKSHHVGTKEHKEVQKYLVNELKKIGLTPEVQIQSVVNNKWRAGTTVENIIAKIEGTQEGKSLLLLSHYDSNPHSSLGASDAGSGIVTILEGVRAFLDKGIKPKNDIIVLFSDAEELGLLGAQAFVECHPLAKDIGLVLNFEARGSGGSSFMLMETNGKNQKLLSKFLNASPNYPAASSLMYSVYKKLPNDTDLTIFRENANINGFNFAFIDDHFDYHTAQDSYDRMNKESLLHQADYLVTTLKYFSEANLNDFHSNEDYIYLNFPFLKLLSYPFSWILPMLVVGFAALVLLILIGLKRGRITLQGMFKGFLPLLASLFIGGGISYLLWKLILVIHPKYNDILHGFTYNGHYYILATVFLSLWITFKIYNHFSKEKTTDLFIAPILLGLLINTLVYQYLQGAGFLIIPIYSSLLILSILIFMDIKKANKSLLFAIIGIPTVYIFSPMVELFPIALGLKILFVASILTILIIVFLLPIFHEQKQKNRLQSITGFATIIVFILAFYHSGFSVDKKFPNSLVYIQNQDSKEAYWGTYNKNLDNYTKQVFDKDYKEGSISFAEGKSKYNTLFNYHKKAKHVELKNSIVTIAKDTIIENLRHIDINILPQRAINKYELVNTTPLSIQKLTANNALVNKGQPFTNKGTLLIYQMGNTDTSLNLSFVLDKNETPNLTLNEISYDLLSNPSLNIQPRTEVMMPMPFVTNDAIISSRKIKL